VLPFVVHLLILSWLKTHLSAISSSAQSWITRYRDWIISNVSTCKLKKYSREPMFRFPAIEVDPKAWTVYRPFLSGAAGLNGGGFEAAIHSGPDTALGAHPCVALSSSQAVRL
jgi:hypothetical protein